MSTTSPRLHRNTMKRIAERTLDSSPPTSDRARTVYGFKHHALQLTQNEIREAWKQASESIKR